MEALLDSVVAWNWLAYLLIGLVVLIESAGAPIPALTVAMAGGALAGQGRLDFWLVFGATVTGGAVGGLLGYWIGRNGGRGLVERFGRYVWLTPARIAQGEQLCQRHGAKAVVIGRYLPVLCFAGGLLSGITAFPYRRFALFNFLGIVMWATTQLSLAFFFGRSLPLLLEILNRLGLALIVALVVVGLGVWLARRRLRPANPRLEKSEPPS